MLRNSLQPYAGKKYLDSRVTRLSLFASRMRSSYVLGLPSANQDNIKIQEDVRPFSTIPGPTQHWAISILRMFFQKGGITKGLYGYHENLLRKYGEIVKVPRPGKPEIWAFNPEAVMTMFRADPKYPMRGSLETLDKFRAIMQKEAGVFFLNGEKWYKHRSIISKRMLRPPEIGKYIPRLNTIADDMMCRISQIRHPKGHERQSEIDELDQELFQWSFESVGDLLFDRRFGAVSENPPMDAVIFISSVATFLKNIVPVAIVPPMLHKYYKPKYYKDCMEGLGTMYSYAEKFIAEKMDELEKKARDDAAEQDDDVIQEFIPFLLASGKIRPDEIASSIVDTLFAGVDTTSNTLQWILYLLSKNQDKQEVLQKEVDSFTASGNGFTAESLGQLPYLKAIIRETLRLYPLIVAHSRILAKDVVLSGYHVPAGTLIVVSNHAMGRCPDLFYSPDEFHPERWLRDNKHSDVIGYSSLPFGHGVRMCLGRRLAELELQILLTKIIQKYKLSYATDEEVEPYMRGTTVPDRPLRIAFESR